jgi:soluble lytic murein transglycosylase-like protein
MQPRITYCNRCRGLRLGWNKRYIAHWLYCEEGLRTSSRLMARAMFAGILILSFPRPGASVLTAERADRGIQELTVPANAQSDVMTVDAAVASMEMFLKRHQVPEANRTRLAESIVASARKYDLNPKLLASIMIVESRGNPFAISGKDAIGIMQIHLPTWGNTADREDVNLFKIEDNIDFGARILRDYIRRFGVWGAVKRYNGFIPGVPAYEKSGQEYLSKVQRVYEFSQPAAAESTLIQ